MRTIYLRNHLYERKVDFVSHNSKSEGEFIWHDAYQHSEDEFILYDA